MVLSQNKLKSNQILKLTPSHSCKPNFPIATVTVNVGNPTYSYETQGFHAVHRLRTTSLDQWFSTGVPRNPWVPQKALVVPPISEFNWYLLVKSS